MQFITCHSGKLQTLLAGQLPPSQRRGGFVTGLAEVDGMAPGGCFARGAVHELLSEGNAFRPVTWAAWLGRCAAVEERTPLNIDGGTLNSRQEAEEGIRIGPRQFAIHPFPHAPLLFVDPDRTLYPPALVEWGVDLARVFLLRPKNREEGLWAMTECLRCAGVGAVVGNVDRLSRIEARRLQLAAEGGGTVGILMRPTGQPSDIYAAATRWRVERVSGERAVRRWRIQLIHGHGGRVGQGVYVEQLREANSLRTASILGHRPGDAEAGVA